MICVIALHCGAKLIYIQFRFASRAKNSINLIKIIDMFSGSFIDEKELQTNEKISIIIKVL